MNTNNNNGSSNGNGSGKLPALRGFQIGEDGKVVVVNEIPVQLVTLWTSKYVDGELIGKKVIDGTEKRLVARPGLVIYETEGEGDDEVLIPCGAIHEGKKKGSTGTFPKMALFNSETPISTVKLWAKVPEPKDEKASSAA